MPRFRRSRCRKKGSARRASPHTLFSRRLTMLGCLFVGVCLLYGGILVSLLVKDNDFSLYVEQPSLPAGGSVQTVTIQAVRGEIYDRNGKPLVTNVYSYDLQLDYSSFLSSGGAHARNKHLLALLAQLDSFELSLNATSSFPLEGSYPHLSYSAQAQDPTTTQYADLLRVLDAVGLAPNASADALVAYYVNTYDLQMQTDGIPAYTSEQITRLLQLYYDMDRTAFGVSNPYTLVQNVSAALISSQKELATPGVTVSMRADRVYHYPGYATHILGRVGKIFAEDWDYYNAMGYPMNAVVGVSGCENAFETLLHGTDGEMQITLDQNGNVVSKQIITQPIAGQDIRLTLDISLQIAAEDSLRERLSSSSDSDTSQKATAGSVVAMNAQTGEVLALASAPSYDAAQFLEQYDELLSDSTLPLLNRAVSATYEAGDMMHLVTAVAGLSERVITTSTLWQDGGKLTVGSETLVCPKFLSQSTTHGHVGVSTALTDACDVFFGSLGVELGSAAFCRWESALGIGQKTGIEIGENEGKRSNASLDFAPLLATAAIGQAEARCTPVQLCSMLATLLSGGERYEAHLLSDVRDFTTSEVLYQKKPQLLSQAIITTEHVQLLLRAMKNQAAQFASLTDLNDRLRAQNISVGCLGTTVAAASGEGDHALLLAFGVPDGPSSSQSPVSVAVVLENGQLPSLAADLAAATLGEWYE